jgi:hypothetical protein
MPGSCRGREFGSFYSYHRRHSSSRSRRRCRTHNRSRLLVQTQAHSQLQNVGFVAQNARIHEVAIPCILLSSSIILIYTTWECQWHPINNEFTMWVWEHQVGDTAAPTTPTTLVLTLKSSFSKYHTRSNAAGSKNT